MARYPFSEECGFGPDPHALQFFRQNPTALEAGETLAFAFLDLP
jgi:hypothetical protein